MQELPGNISGCVANGWHGTAQIPPAILLTNVIEKRGQEEIIKRQESKL